MKNIEGLLEKYKNNYAMRKLVQLIPQIGGIIDSDITIVLNRIKEERLEAFFQELSQGKINKYTDYLMKEDGIQKFLITLNYVLGTQQREKIKMFASIFINSFDTDNKIENFDVYEDFAGILKELTYREICALAIFESFNSVPREKEENDLQWVNKFWNEFEIMIEKELGISKDYVNNYMIRITRTGCYEDFNGNYCGYTAGKGKLTPLYYELKHYIIKHCD
jgi:hypothetical protein